MRRDTVSAGARTGRCMRLASGPMPDRCNIGCATPGRKGQDRAGVVAAADPAGGDFQDVMPASGCYPGATGGTRAMPDSNPQTFNILAVAQAGRLGYEAVVQIGRASCRGGLESAVDAV